MWAARSASGAALAALVLSGCTTTQDVNTRFALRAARVIAGRTPVRVTVANPAVDVRRVAVVSGHASAIVVELASRTAQPLTDLPISVGIGGRYVNARHGLDYFQTRVAAIAPHGTTRWVFVTHRPVPAHGRPFARVGRQAAPHAASVGVLPRISVTGAAGRVHLRNTSDVPQYNLPVYALVQQGGRYVAAGRATVEQLDPHAGATVSVPLAGRAPAGPIELEALPTIFR